MTASKSHANFAAVAGNSVEPFDKQVVLGCLSAGWARTISEQFQGNNSAFARAFHADRNQVSAATGGRGLPELQTVLNSLLVCPNALAELFALYGFRLVPLDAAMSPDMLTLSKLCRLATRLSEALEDGRRDRHETIELAHEIRDLMPALDAMVTEADDIKTGGNVRSIRA